MAVLTFDLVLDNPSALLANGQFVARLEGAILQQLPGCKRLLRWAVVNVSDNKCMVEGAYLQ